MQEQKKVPAPLVHVPLFRQGIDAQISTFALLIADIRLEMLAASTEIEDSQKSMPKNTLYANSDTT